MGGLSVEIRRLTAGDWEAYRSIRLEALQSAPEAFGSSFGEERLLTPEDWSARAAGDDHRVMMGAFAGQELQGMAGLIRERRAKTRHKGSIVSVYVPPVARGKGVARQMLTALLAEARTMAGLEQITLAVVSDNTPARALYESLGFQVYGTERRALKLGDEYRDEELMVLFL